MGPPKEVSPRRRKTRKTAQGLRSSRGRGAGGCFTETPELPHQVIGTLVGGVRVVLICRLLFHLGNDDRPVRRALGPFLGGLQRNELELARHAYNGAPSTAAPIELLLGHMDLLDLVLHDELIGHIAGAAVDHGLLDDLFGLGLTLLARGLLLTLQIQLTVALGLLRTGTLYGRSGILHLLRGILGGLL